MIKGNGLANFTANTDEQPMEEAPIMELTEDVADSFMEGIGALNMAGSTEDYDSAIAQLEIVKDQIGDMPVSDFIDGIVGLNGSPEIEEPEMEDDSPNEGILSGYAGDRGEMTPTV
jgi:hypothetical protein